MVIEAEADATCDAENVYIIGIMELLRALWSAPGDSNAPLPPLI
jgi:carbamoyl-phosphate synthase large subunit